jgi:hypothetical protein
MRHARSSYLQRDHTVTVPLNYYIAESATSSLWRALRSILLLFLSSLLLSYHLLNTCKPTFSLGTPKIRTQTYSDTKLRNEPVNLFIYVPAHYRAGRISITHTHTQNPKAATLDTRIVWFFSYNQATSFFFRPVGPIRGMV